MDTLGYTHMAAVYEESYGPLGIRSFEPPAQLKLRQVASALAITILVLAGGLTAMIGSALSPNHAAPQHQIPGL